MVTPPAAVTVARHPLVLDKVTRLRDRTTEPPVFRALVRDLSRLLFYEAIADVRLEAVTVDTPLAPCAGQRLAERIGLVPILRAGLGMADALLELVPEAQVWHLGLYRDEDTHRPVTYYNKLSADAGLDLAVVVDPMLATGGSAVEALTILKRGGVRRLKFLALIAAPEGVRTLTEAHPDVRIYLGAIDSHLDSHCYIVPGLGDAGDRQFSTC
jgi:uracil phosphoribosyltransferase